MVDLIYGFYLMQDRLNQRSINHLFHFTKYSNFPSIMANGLVRRSQLDHRGMVYAFNDNMRYDGHPNSLSVSIGFPNYRMFWPTRQKYPEDSWVVLVLSTDVLINKTCAFYSMNAATGCYKVVPPETLQNAVAFDAMFTDVNGRNRADLKIPDDCTTDPQAEVLVFYDIEPNYILQVATQNKMQEQEIRQAYAHFGDDNVAMFSPLFRPRKDYEHWR